MNTFVIAINLFSEPNYKGNCSRYYFVSKRGDKITLSGIVNAKHYLSEKVANNMAEKLKDIYQDALIEVIKKI